MLRRLLGVTLPLIPKPIVRRVASRYVAGETLDAAIAKVEELNRRGLEVTLALLGEEVTERATAEAAVEEYLQVLERLEPAGLRSGISIKLTLLGLEIDETFCRDNVDRIAAAARARGNFVRIDMEDRTATDPTLRIYRAVQEKHGNLGVVFQAYRRRTLQDIGELPREGANVRLCKGIYIEPRTVAWKGYETIRHNFVQALEKLIARGVYVGIATHDEALVCAAVALIDRFGLPGNRYEFQMLLGVDAELRRILLAEGHRLRVYVPYGRDWYAYSIRRLRENPEIARHVLSAMLGRR